MPIKTKSGKWKWGNVERSSKKELVQTVYGIWKKNGSKGSFSEFWHGNHRVNESSGERIYAYHCTNIDPEIIKKEGWKVGDGFTLDNQFENLYKKYLPKVPVFVSNLDVLVWDSKAKYCIKLDITGLKLFPDFGYLPDFGAYYDYDEECFYWENEDDLDSNKKLKDFVLDNCDNLTLYADCFDGEDSFNVLGTACVDGSKLKDRIVEWKSSIKESYEPPYTLDTIKQKYGDKVYRKLRDDPVHRFRAETGIEVIHKEPTRDEFERIVKNWDLMTPEQKKQSDEFSMKQFGNNNKNRIDLLRKEYDFKVGDKVKVKKGLRCFQSGHTGKIIEIEPPNKYGWSSFVIKFDEPKLGAMGFYSGNIEKMNESAILEDKTNMIKKLVLPDIENEQEKEQFKSNLIEWFKSNSSYETKIDWNKWKTLTKSDFEKLIKSKELSKNQQKHKKRIGSGKDAKDLFKDINDRKFKIIDETDNWLFVAPLNYKGAVFCDSKECGGGSAKWCIGYEKDDSFWNQYVGNGEKFIMIFNKNFETMPEKKLFTDLKYMIENDSTEYEVKDQIKIWEQDDRDFSINYYDSKFEINSEDFKKLFDKIDEKEYVLERFSISGTTLKNIRPIEFNHLIIPDGIKEVAEFACERDAKIYELTIPSSVENIDQYAFNSAEMENIHIKEDSNLELIGRAAFSDNNIETLDLSKLTKLRFIGDEAFRNNRSLKVVHLPISLNDMGYDVFDGCKSLMTLVIPERFFDPENDYEVLKSICGDNIPWDDIEIFTIDENGIKEKRN